MFLCFTKSRCAWTGYKAVTSVTYKVQQRLLNMSCQVEQLTTRSLIRVSGDDVTSFLQGMVTNDMKHLQDRYDSLFAMFLNTKGRVLYDSIIYKTRVKNTYFIECDSEGIQDLVKHLKMYRVRRNIEVVPLDNEWKLWVLFNPKVETIQSDINNIKQEKVVPCTFPNFENEKGHNYLHDIIINDNITLYTDPRLSNLGSRVIAPISENVVKAVEAAGVHVETVSPWSYRMYRYSLGIGEGMHELPIGKCFPLEANCDYLHGVSFHKGCYIGQELTARTHHTGVVRKRLMPLRLHSEIPADIVSFDTPIEDATGLKKSPIGKLRGWDKNFGLGLLKIVEALEVRKCRIGNAEGETLRPFWWPQELSKERVDSNSTKKS